MGQGRVTGRVACFVVTAIGTLAFAAPAGAVDFPVLNTGDAGADTLRQAIIDSEFNDNSPATTDTITITATGTLQLLSALPSIDENVEINGPGADQFTIRRSFAGAGSVINISSNGDDVTIRGVAITNGFGEGGGVRSDGALVTLERVAIVGNFATSGGTSAGGGIAAQGLVLRSSTVSGNVANGVGGGIQAGAGATIENSTISGNIAGLEQVGATGGGVRLNGSGGVITNSTFANNSTSSAVGENLFVNGATMKATLLAGAGDDCGSGGSGLDSLGFNLSDDASCSLDQPTDQPSTAPQLLALADNGGPTLTHALPLSSPAVDGGASSGLATDQRGELRPFEVGTIANAAGGDGADIGAFELQDPGPDVDGDGVLVPPDNCPAVVNPDQLNTDGDEAGNVCDADDDGDGVLDTADRCALLGGSAPFGCPAAQGTLTAKFSADKQTVSGKLVVQTAPDCAAGRVVKVFRKKRGADKQVAKATTKASGKWSKKKDLDPGKYYASVGEVVIDDLAQCTKEKSKAFEV